MTGLLVLVLSSGFGFYLVPFLHIVLFAPFENPEEVQDQTKNLSDSGKFS
jgi:hypothetical protein